MPNVILKMNKKVKRAYDEIADICYRFFNKNEIVLVEGRLDTKMYIVLKKLKK